MNEGRQALEDSIVCHEDGYEYRWKQGHQYRLEKVTDQPGILRIPFENQWITQETLEGTMIILCEVGGGAHTFIRWLTGQGSGWQLMANQQALVEALDTGPQGRASFVLDGTNNSEVFQNDAALTRLVEDPGWVKKAHNLVVVTTEPEAKRYKRGKGDLFSSLMDRGDVYRLPSFNIFELRNFAQFILREKFEKPDGKWVNDVAEKSKSWIGGQPILTKYLFSKLSKEISSNTTRASLIKMLENISNALKKTTRIANHWGGSLARICTDLETKRCLESYIYDTKPSDSNKFNKEDLWLYLNGWIGEVGQGEKWGIRSECHKGWAKTISRGGHL